MGININSKIIINETKNNFLFGSGISISYSLFSYVQNLLRERKVNKF
jgi:hypothetical protein